MKTIFKGVNPYEQARSSISINGKDYSYFNLRAINPEKYGKTVLIVYFKVSTEKFLGKR